MDVVVKVSRAEEFGVLGSDPPPLVVPWGWGGPSLGQPKIFRRGSLCCCVGDCVVGHYHLYPLYFWQDILLTFAEMELDSTTMFPPGTSVMFIRSTGGNLFWRRSLDGQEWGRIGTWGSHSKTWAMSLF